MYFVSFLFSKLQIYSLHVASGFEIKHNLLIAPPVLTDQNSHSGFLAMRQVRRGNCEGGVMSLGYVQIRHHAED